MNVFTDPLEDLKAYIELKTCLEQGETGGETDRHLPGALADSCVDSQKAHLIFALSREESLKDSARFRLVLTYSDLRARQIAQDCALYDRNTALFPARDLIFYQADLRGGEVDRERLRCLRRILEGKPVTVITTFAALLTPQIPLWVFRDNILEIARRDTVDLEAVIRQLVSMGYEKNYQAERPGQFAVRGDILDIFDLTQENPIRVELWGDEVDTIRSFDVLSQRSVEQLEVIRVFPATEMVLDDRRLFDGLKRIKKEADQVCAGFREKNDPEKAHRLRTEIDRISEEARELRSFTGLESFIQYFYPMTESFLDLFPLENTMVFFDEPMHILQHASAVEEEFAESMAGRALKGYILPGQKHLIRESWDVIVHLERYRRAGLAVLAGAPEKEDVQITLPDSGFVHGTAGNGSRLSLRFDKAVQIHAREASLSGMSYEKLREELDRLRRKKERTIIVSPSRTRAKRLAQDLTADGVTAFYRENTLKTLLPGEVMTFAGRMRRGFAYPEIGFTVLTESEIFGEEKKKKKKVRRYDGGEQIRKFSELKVGDYVVHEQYGIGIYRGVEKIVVEHIARDYLKIEYGAGGVLFIMPTELSTLQKYAAAEGAKKPKLNKLGTQEWTRTRSRVQKSVEEVADDLVELYAKRQARQGHVYGKDTVWQRELEEMFPFEETEDQLAAIEDTKRDMESGRIMDRLICGDVGYGKTEIAVRAAFKAVQEGMQVAVLVPTTILAQQHYNTFTERMHSFPVNIEVLSRFRTSKEQKATIHGLETGAVDIVIGTHRLLSKDVTFKNLGLLVVDEEQRFGVTHKEKIKKMKEDVDVLTLSATPIPRTLHMSMVGIRDMSVLEQAPGDRVPIQTFVMEYNEELVREAIVRELSRKGQVYYVHNRVNDIARAVLEVQELVPEARVTYAHGQMKESELEQIMYDFISGGIDVLMYKGGQILKEQAVKRLAAIREFTDLGSGYRIAMRDLEIRGAGSILGRVQHGHMQAVGYDLYCKLLEGAVRKAKGEEPREEIQVTVNLLVDAFLPENYIVNEEQKLEIYKRIASISSSADVEDVREELMDRFGKIPLPAQNLLRVALIRSVAGLLEIEELTGGGGSLRIVLQARARGIRAEQIPVLVKEYRGRLSFMIKEKPQFQLRYPVSGKTIKDEETLLQETEELLRKMALILR